MAPAGSGTWRPAAADQTQEESIWQEWLAIYLEHLRRPLRPDQIAELEAAVPQAVADPSSLHRLVDRATASEGHFLIEFLASVADARRRQALVLETQARLHLFGRHTAETPPLAVR